jgi:hypothetical protein
MKDEQEVAAALVAHESWRWRVGMAFTTKHIKRGAGGAAVYPMEFVVCEGWGHWSNEAQTVSEDEVPPGALPLLAAPCTWGVLLGMCVECGSWPDINPWQDAYDEDKGDAGVGAAIGSHLLDLWGWP